MARCVGNGAGEPLNGVCQNCLCAQHIFGEVKGKRPHPESCVRLCSVGFIMSIMGTH